MPRDTGGDYSLPAGNPVASGSLIESTWANNTMTDIAEALTNSLSRLGEGGMLAPFEFADGTESLPGATWSNETSSGMWRATLGDIRISVLGQQLFRWYQEEAFVWDDVNAEWQKVVASNSIAVDVDGNVTFDNNVTIAGDLTVDGALIAGGGVYVRSIVAGTNVTVDNTDPSNPIVSASGGGGGGGLTFDTTTKVADFTAAADYFYIVDPVTAAVDVTLELPTGPTAGDRVGYVIITQSATYNVILSSPDSTINGSATVTKDSSLGIIGLTVIFTGTEWVIYESANLNEGAALLLE